MAKKTCQCFVGSHHHRNTAIQILCNTVPLIQILSIRQHAENFLILLCEIEKDLKGRNPNQQRRGKGRGTPAHASKMVGKINDNIGHSQCKDQALEIRKF